MSTTVMLLGALTLLSFTESLLHTVKGFFLRALVIGALALPGLYAYGQFGAKVPGLASLTSAVGDWSVPKAQAQAPQERPRAESSILQQGLAQAGSVANPFGSGKPQAAQTAPQAPAAEAQKPGPRNVYLERYGDPRTRPGAAGRISDEHSEPQQAQRRERARPQPQLDDYAAPDNRRQPQIDDYGQRQYGQRQAHPRRGEYAPGEDPYERAARERGRRPTDDYAGRGRPLYDEEPSEEYPRQYRRGSYERPIDDYGSRGNGRHYRPQAYDGAPAPDPYSVQGLRRWVGNAVGLN